MEFFHRAVERFESWPAWVRWSAGAAAGLFPLAVIALIALPIVAERQLVQRASEYGLSARVDSVRLGLGSLWFRDVVLEDPPGPGAKVTLAAVQVRASVFGSAPVSVFGGQVELRGSEKELGERIQRWRGGQANAVRAASHPRREIAVEGIALSWLEAPGRELRSWGVRARQDEQGNLDAAADLLRISRRSAGVELRALETSVVVRDGRRRFSRLEAASAMARLELAADEAEASPPPADAEPRAGKPLRVARAKRAAPPAPLPPSAPVAAPSETPSPWWTRWAATRAALAPWIGDDFRGGVVALSVEARRGGESLRIGPNRLGLKREGQVLSLEFLPNRARETGATPLSVRARLPLGSAPTEFHLSGGPVSLSTLGVREGDFGLSGVDQARFEAEADLVIPAEPGRTQISSKGLLENVRVRRAALGPHEIMSPRLGWRFEGEIGPELGAASLKLAEVSVGDVRLEASGKVTLGGLRSHVDLSVEVPLASCSALLAAIPRGMAPLIEGVQATGTFALKGAVAYDSNEPKASRVSLKVDNQCRISAFSPGIAPQRFRDSWMREVKGADGLPMVVNSGPGSADWVPYEDISPHMETAVLICEDGGFFGHRGFDYKAIENSIRMNLEAGRFLRGGSTVSMQLTKNLYLSKEKTLARKLQEAVLTLLLEQQLSKHELMELYLNVVEFGPGIYGVRQAAHYYFNEEPRQLSLGQALYLASILPSPDSQHFLPDGRVSAGWSGYLRKLMLIAKKIRRVTEEELNVALAEQVAFRQPNLLGTAIESVDERSEPEAEPDAAPE